MHLVEADRSTRRAVLPVPGDEAAGRALREVPRGPVAVPPRGGDELVAERVGGGGEGVGQRAVARVVGAVGDRRRPGRTRSRCRPARRWSARRRALRTGEGDGVRESSAMRRTSAGIGDVATRTRSRRARAGQQPGGDRAAAAVVVPASQGGGLVLDELGRERGPPDLHVRQRAPVVGQHLQRGLPDGVEAAEADGDAQRVVVEQLAEVRQQRVGAVVDRELLAARAPASRRLAARRRAPRAGAACAVRGGGCTPGRTRPDARQVSSGSRNRARPSERSTPSVGRVVPVRRCSPSTSVTTSSDDVGCPDTVRFPARACSRRRRCDRGSPRRPRAP